MRPKRRLGQLSAGVALLILAGLGVVALLRSPLFSVRHLELSGSGAAAIRAAAGIQLGESIWQVDPQTVEERLLHDPRLAEARVSLKLPGTVQIRFRWRQPVALVTGPAGTLAIDATGVILPPPRAADLPFLTGFQVSTPLYGRDTGSGPRITLAVIQSLGPELAAEISEIHYQNGRVRLYTLSGTPVSLGSPVDLSRKLTSLLGIMESIRQDKTPVRSIDLSLPGQPLVDLAKGTTPPAPAALATKPAG